MAREVHQWTVTVPAGTTAAAPLVYPLTMPARILRRLQVRVPPGPRGTVGWAIGAAGQPILPWEPGQWIVTDNETVDWPLDDQITSGAWQLFAYNLGGNSHLLYVRMLVDVPYLEGPAIVSSVPLVASTIAAAIPSAGPAAPTDLASLVAPEVTTFPTLFPFTAPEIAPPPVAAAAGAAGAAAETLGPPPAIVSGGGVSVIVSPDRAPYVTGTGLQLSQQIGYGPGGEGTWEQQRLVNAGLQTWAAPGVTTPTPAGSGPAGAAAALGALGLSAGAQVKTVSATGQVGTTTVGAAAGAATTSAVHASAAEAAAVPKLQAYVAKLAALPHPDAQQAKELATYRARLKAYTA